MKHNSCLAFVNVLNMDLTGLIKDGVDIWIDEAGVTVICGLDRITWDTVRMAVQAMNPTGYFAQ